MMPRTPQCVQIEGGESTLEPNPIVIPWVFFVRLIKGPGIRRYNETLTRRHFIGLIIQLIAAFAFRHDMDDVIGPDCRPETVKRLADRFSGEKNLEVFLIVEKVRFEIRSFHHYLLTF
ncbi:hypothetical protein SDC9_175127 [bioreactor metagenome]|uniref:Uncharacterized protein n=1 Tax=bioreactor metagenome TaxID=1076179 RepID=A0A645GVN4_9ZZZZ